MTPAENTVKVGGRQFQFIPLSIDAVIKLQSLGFNEKFAAIDFGKLAEDKVLYAEFQKSWAEFCNAIFKKGLLWKLLARWGGTPKVLHFSVISLDELVEITKAFFIYAGALPQPANEQSGTSTASK